MELELDEELRRQFNNKHKVIAHFATVDAGNGYAPEIRPMTLLEDGWRFYIATSVSSRKAKEMVSHPKAAFLVYFHDGKNAGYLRVTGKLQTVTDAVTRDKIVKAAAYPLECRWKGGAADPNLYFTRIIPERAEYLRPGEDESKDISREFPR